MTTMQMGPGASGWAAVRRVVFGYSGRQALLIFLGARLLLTLWAALIVLVLPPPAEPDEVLRPYVGAPVLSEGVEALLLGPWQRFDTQRYLALARDGYSDENSVFPPLYPLLIRYTGQALELVSPLNGDRAQITAALLIANLAALGALLLLHHIASHEMDRKSANRTLLYLVFFPTGFFLFAAYTESLFLLLALGSLWAARRDRPLLAGLLGFAAALTRLTGWILVIPLAYEYLRQRNLSWRQIEWRALGVLLPGVASAGFLAWRGLAGLAPLAQVYQAYWYQVTSFPGLDMLTSLGTLVTGVGPRAGEITLLFDWLVAIFLGVTTVLVFRRFGPTYGLYSALLLLFMLLPSSDLKPLYSFSRYALAFFPTFMLLGYWGYRPWVNRLVLYPSLVLYLYFSGQFFMWGWVA